LRLKHWLRLLENGILRKLFRADKWYLAGNWRRQHNEELRDLYCSADIIRVSRSRSLRWAGHVACMGRTEMCTLFRFEKDHLEDLSLNVKITLTSISLYFSDRAS
jgi:hypothetical protein